MSTEHHDDGRLMLEQQVSLPDTLDILIVGGGPAGTATAFRAKELGLDALVIDFDDILRRIRDYPKEKLILPNFGGGDKMAFPAGDQCIARLHFDPIDKDDLCATWKTHYRELSVPAKIGPELTGLERAEDDDVWVAQAYNHRTREPETYRARHVVLALGRGVPRRFDIPGNTDGIAYRLDDPAYYTDGPVCVVGGGTSAAEAVIAVSHAKIEAEDECPVYWSYRGSKMPRVSKALADAFFEAYVGNGNIRYFPYSEPLGVFAGPDRVDRLAVRVDRKAPAGRPPELVLLEFPKDCCVACIGEDIPAGFLNDLGVELATLGNGKKKQMMTVTPLLETQQRNLYLIGDLLSQSYLETEDFDASPDTFTKIKHRGNIKSSLRDGAFVAEVIKQRLEGRADDEIDVVIEDAAPAAPDEGATRISEVVGTAPEDEASSGPAPSVAKDEEEAPRLVAITPTGVEAEEFTLRASGSTTIGREDCDISFENDTLVSERHASITGHDDRYFLRDDASRTGTYLQLRPAQDTPVDAGGLLRTGRQVLVIGRKGDGYVLQHYDAQGQLVQRHALREGTTTFGRSGGKADPDVVLDREDMTLSRMHFSITVDDDGVKVTDFNSRNGTYLKIDAERELHDGDLFRVGSHQLRFQIQEIGPSKTGAFRVAPEAAAEAEAAAPAKPEPEPAEETPAQEPHVVVSGQDIEGAIDPDETLLEWADENEVELDYECWIGMCGCDVIRVLEGADNLNEPSDDERKTLERKGLEAGPCRLACMAKATGPVVVEVAD